MELLVNRKIHTEVSTIGDFSINGVFFSHCLEDKDRGLHSDMSLAEIAKIKIKHLTAIPTGRYKVEKYNSPKHGLVPILINVPGFDYVEIHAGNYSQDTDGCLLLGKDIAPDMVTESNATIAKFYPIVFGAIDKGENVYITYI